MKDKGLRRVPRLRWVGWDTSFVPTEGPQVAGRWGEKERRRRGDGEGVDGGNRRGGKMGFGKEDGEEFGQVEVALVPVVELHVPDEFVVSGHVVVSDHAAVPLTAELHPDVSYATLWSK